MHIEIKVHLRLNKLKRKSGLEQSSQTLDAGTNY
jgi:hypothetical protein